MKTTARIRSQLSAGEFDFTRHAFQRVVERDISEQEIREAGRAAQVIEQYPRDKYSPSCLLLGFTWQRRPLHIQVSKAHTPFVRIITLYEPTAAEWIDYRVRR